MNNGYELVPMEQGIEISWVTTIPPWYVRLWYWIWLKMGYRGFRLGDHD